MGNPPLLEYRPEQTNRSGPSFVVRAGPARWTSRLSAPCPEHGLKRKSICCGAKEGQMLLHEDYPQKYGTT